MKYSTIKEIKEQCIMIDIEEWREVIEGMSNDEKDFHVQSDDFRFIHKDEIDKIMQDELASDEYILGCFNCGFLTDILDIPYEVIESMQKNEAFEAIGIMILRLGKLEELQDGYVSADGYGHHFAHYNGNEDMINNFYVFRVN